jgi:hypothetical protein
VCRMFFLTAPSCYGSIPTRRSSPRAAPPRAPGDASSAPPQRRPQCVQWRRTGPAPPPHSSETARGRARRAWSAQRHRPDLPPAGRARSPCAVRSAPDSTWRRGAAEQPLSLTSEQRSAIRDRRCVLGTAGADCRAALAVPVVRPFPPAVERSPPQVSSRPST